MSPSSTFFTLLILFLQQQPSFSFGSTTGDYLYHTSDNDSNSESGGNGNGKVWPIVDYVKPDRNTLESKDDYNNRLLHPHFLTEEYNKPRVVEFYAPWCGHCQHYKPQYIQLGRKTKTFNSNIDFFAISCVAHKQLCSDKEVRGYPTLQFYPEYNATYIPITHKVKLDVEILNNEYFLKYSKLDVLHSDGYMSNKDIDDEHEHENNDNDNDNDKDHDNENAKASNAINESDNNHKNIKMYEKAKQQSQNDMYTNAASSFDFAIRSSIFMTNDALSSTQFFILNDWLILLQQTLPKPNDDETETDTTTSTSIPHPDMMAKPLHQIDALLSNLSYVTENEEQLLEVLSNADKKNKYDHDHDKEQQEQEHGEERWTTICSKGVHGAGYTCGLWQLLHLVTIGMVHHNQQQLKTNKNQQQSLNTNLLSTMRTADTIRNYIEYYFTCDECRLNFIQMYENCNFERCARLSMDSSLEPSDWKELALWLWEVHNDVNVRLLHEESIKKSDGDGVTKGDEERVKWPSKVDCPLCWYDGGGWNDEVVYRYLDSVYWPQSPERIVALYHEKKTGIKSIDPLSISYYVSIGGIILLLVLNALLMKRRRKVKNLKSL